TPVDSETDYLGFKIEADMCFRLFQGRFSVRPLAGLGLRWWERGINSSQSSIGPVSGYVERWLSFYGRLGGRGILAIRARSRLFLEFVLKIPLYNAETVLLDYALPGQSDIHLRPGLALSLLLQLGVKIEVFKAHLFYELLNFTESDVDDGFVQPRSVGHLFGICAGVEF
ncbi:MAG: hypothetical protein ACYTHM_23575, partial [Planctomycetota bacterium]